MKQELKDDLRQRILMRVEVMCGDKNKAVDWFEKSEIPGLGGKTAAQAVKDGDGDAVLQHLNDMDNGVYA